MKVGAILARKGENIYKRKDGRYEGRYIKGRHSDGKAKYGYIYGYEYLSVKKQLVIKKAEQQNLGNSLSEIGCGSFKGWIEHWLYKLAMPNIKQSTFGCYYTIAINHLIPNLGDIELLKLNADNIQDFMQSLVHKNLSASTICNIMRLLKAILEKARLDRHIKNNPCKDMRMPRKNKQCNRSLTKEERKRLIHNIIGQPDMQLEILLPLYTGMRVGVANPH